MQKDGKIKNLINVVGKTRIQSFITNGQQKAQIGLHLSSFSGVEWIYYTYTQQRQRIWTTQIWQFCWLHLSFLHRKEKRQIRRQDVFIEVKKAQYIKLKSKNYTMNTCVQGIAENNFAAHSIENDRLTSWQKNLGFRDGYLNFL